MSFRIGLFLTKCGSRNSQIYGSLNCSRCFNLYRNHSYYTKSRQFISKNNFINNNFKQNCKNNYKNNYSTRTNYENFSIGQTLKLNALSEKVTYSLINYKAFIIIASTGLFFIVYKTFNTDYRINCENCYTEENNKNITVATQHDLIPYYGANKTANDTDLTYEEALLAASDKELLEYNLGVASKSKVYRKWCKFCYSMKTYIYDPTATTFRAIYLFFLFLPVFLSYPITYFGPKYAYSPNNDFEKAGTAWWYSYLVWSMEKAGPTFVKLAQWAASRRDVFPSLLCEYLSRLHSNVTPHSFKDTKKLVEASLGGQRIETVFEEFPTTPIGVGAIAQVYCAKLANPQSLQKVPSELQNDNNNNNTPSILKQNQKTETTEVAVKVIHPYARKLVTRDLAIMSVFASILNIIPGVEWLSFPDEVENFGRMMRLQLDLRIEEANLQRFAHNFTHREGVKFPLTYHHFTTRSVLVEEYIHAIPMQKILDLINPPLNTSNSSTFSTSLSSRSDFSDKVNKLNEENNLLAKELAELGLNSFFKMLLLDNFIHADLHPGNMFVQFYKPNKYRINTDVASLTRAETDDMVHTTSELLKLASETTTSLTSEAKNLNSDEISKLQGDSFRKYLKKLAQEGYRPQIAFIDAGLVTELSPTNRRNFLDLFKAISSFDGYKVGQLMIERSRTPDTAINKEVFALKMEHIVNNIKSQTFALGNMRIGDLLSDAMSMVRQHHVRLEADFINVIISVLLLEGIGRQLDPNLDLLKSALPILRQLGTTGSSSFLKSDITNDDTTSMLKVWVAIEAREFVTTSIQEIQKLVKYDLLSPNI